ncbi:hypothetical protein [Flavobacterium sp.]|uniref:hypothetical protein n=1 Tax=Flavobacterium sp. TaxID=239 RepID=UPI00286E4338|nr:hypothetical protein [Flavobacterium sp.]
MNLRKHKLLGILSEQYILSEIGETENKEIGLNDDVILEKLKMSKYKYELIKQSLLDSAEVERHNPRYILGLYSTLKGVASFNDKKYTKAFFDDIINILKNIVQIVIPILSLFIAYYAIQLKISEVNNYNQKQIDTLRKEIKILKSNKLKSETQTKTYPKK